ncbi:KpsF/GutQ family sugar-phosphate isomerase [Erythrobacter sp. SCSIO 43205]|uniref:KpsF/GutQ family sugar-phosphate isomerase n=1 Tax=Erythrobacter sp. SCSIO 43205 TaxID=2779361 RepID=UPI001CA7D385|nr:KpsF/GutQ family sugar-phosphate isomerase [Erythrobacter sp. SCSIO 43205]UAB78825.1 KpsF/GutQ family sugar-phosphate isomerase [Erythrobacter sp. SCSIO 43205]
MNALTAIKGQNASICDAFYAAIASEKAALQTFLQAPPQASIQRVIALLAAQTKPVIVTGIGKSGHIAAKIAATMSSLGTPALFLNAAEAAHGDLGAVQEGSVVIMLSNSGTTQEITRLVPMFRARGCVLVAIVGRKGSPIARAAEHLILAEVENEADHIGMAPTSSTTLHLAIGDALAVAASQLRGFTRDDFLRHHPAGLLGRQMIPVANLMRQGDDLPTVQTKTKLIDLLTVMSAKRMGAACVVGEDGHLLGLVVDGDVRRHLQWSMDLSRVTAGDIMQTDPQTVCDGALLGDVLSARAQAKRAWLVLPVIDNAGRLNGMIHAQDILD